MGCVLCDASDIDFRFTEQGRVGVALDGGDVPSLLLYIFSATRRARFS